MLKSGMSPSGGRGDVPGFAGRGCAPHFLCLRQRKRAAPGPKEKRWRPEFSPCGENSAEDGGLRSRCGGEREFVPDALWSRRTGIMPSRIRWRGCRFRGGHRIELLLFPLPLLPLSGERNPKGRGRSPFPLCRFKGVWGEIGIPPRFWRGSQGEVSLRQRHLPLSPGGGHRISYQVR